MSSNDSKDIPGIILAKIFKTLLDELGVHIERYQYLISNIIRQFNLDNIYKVSSLINGITKEVFGTTISWKVFIKALLFLGTAKFTIFLQKDGKSPMVFTTIDISDKDLMGRLFNFNNRGEDDDEETKLGELLKQFLDQVVDKYHQGITYNDAIFNYVELLKKTNRHHNKSLKGNLVKEFKKDSVTWKVFIKALVVYGITNPVIGVTIYNKQNKHHTVSFTVNLDNIVL